MTTKPTPQFFRVDPAWIAILVEVVRQTPLPSFNGAMDSLAQVISDLHVHAKAATDFASFHKVKVIPDDYIAAIHIYTQAWPSEADALYSKLKQCMTTKSRTRSTLDPWAPYIKLLDTALTSLACASAAPRSVFRGVRWRFPTLEAPAPKEHFPCERAFPTYSFDSFTTNETIARDFVGKQHAGTLFHLDTMNAVDISLYSAFPGEQEVLLRPLTLLVTRKVECTELLDTVVLQEVQQDCNILVLGETGVGKSTFINAFTNYLYNPSIDEAMTSGPLICPIACAFTLTDDNYNSREIRIGDAQTLPAGQSVTQKCQCYSYEIPIADGLYGTLRLIDTPGIGDTRGRAADNQNFDEILAHIRNYPYLNGILILLKPNSSRLTVAFRYCIKELLRHLHRDAARNIVFCFTNSRATLYKPGDTLPPLRELLQELQATTGVSIKTDKSTLYCFDSEAFRYLAAQREGVHFTAAETDSFRTSWNISADVAQALMRHIQALPPHFLKETVSLNQARVLVLHLSEIMANISKLVLKNVAAINDFMQECSRLDEEHSKLDAVKMKRLKRVQVKELAQPRTVCAHKDHPVAVHDGETEYSQICHDDCYVTGVPKNLLRQEKLQGCSAMSSGVCTVCTHPWDTHMHVAYQFIYEDELVADSLIVKKLQVAMLEKQGKQAMLRCLQQEKQEHEAEAKILRETTAKFAAFMKSSAIVVHNDDLRAYMEQEITTEKQKPHPNETTIQNLQKMIAQFNEEVSIFTSHIEQGRPPCTLENFNTMLSEIYALPKYGAQVKQAVDRVNHITQRCNTHAIQRTVVTNENKSTKWRFSCHCKLW